MPSSSALHALRAAGLAVVLAGCNDPAERYTPPPVGGTVDQQDPGDGPPPPGDGDGAAGPPPGDDGAGGGGGGPECQATGVAQEEASFDAGKGVTLKGELVYEGSAANLLIEVVRLIDGSPTAVYGFVCRSGGPAELLLPPGMGEVYLVGFADAENDGPSSTDAKGTTKAIDASKDHSGFKLVLKEGTDLGKVALPHLPLGGVGPGGGEDGPPPDGEDGPPPEGEEGAPPPEGEAGDAPPDGEAGGPPPEGEPPADGEAPPAEGGE